MVIVNPWITLLSFVYFIVAGFGAFVFSFLLPLGEERAHLAGLVPPPEAAPPGEGSSPRGGPLPLGEAWGPGSPQWGAPLL